MQKTIFNSSEVGLKTIRRFETRFAQIYNAEYSLSCSSCTSGIYSSLVSVGVKEGDKIIIPGLTWPGTYIPAINLNCNLLSVDMSRDKPVVDLHDLKNLLKNDFVKVVLSVGLYGLDEHLGNIQNLCKKYGAIHIVDAAQLINRKTLLNSCDIAVYSFGPNKNEMVLGGGGMIITNNPEIYDNLLLTTQHPFRVHSESINTLCTKDSIGIGNNFQMHPAAAKMGLKILANFSQYDPSMKLKLLTIYLESNNIPLVNNNGLVIFLEKKLLSSAIRKRIKELNLKYYHFCYKNTINVLTRAKEIYKRRGIEFKFRFTNRKLRNSEYWENNFLVIGE
jgi:dTDP-4-amino-4,6-dideoxygalactose transaminase